MMRKMQLNKYLALCGVASRRKSNNAIIEGRVKINGKKITELGIQIDSENDEVKLDDVVLIMPEHFRYILLNKPENVVTSAIDHRNRKTVLDLIDIEERIFPVGRLDLDTTGVLMLTNDGDLAYRLAHPKFEIDKVYEAFVEGIIEKDDIIRLHKGVEIGDNVEVSGEVKVLEKKSDSSLLEIIIHEGKKRQIKRMMKKIGHPVLFLSRINFAGLTVDGVCRGKWRDLKREEVDMLYTKTGLECK